MASTAATASTADHAPGNDHLGTRRDFLFIATATVGAVGAAAALVPLVDQMNPDASTLAAGGPVDLDVSKIAEGAQVMILQSMQSPQMISLLADPNSDQTQQPPYANNWHRSLKPEFGVLVGICTHLGCIPLFYPTPSATSPVTNWPGGYFCPCHGSKYDPAGRVFSGVPAPYNLPVPPYMFVNDTTLRVGVNDSSASAWNFDSIRQL
jgi:ubiquinol-cytochrome c reductase iron-sulfur subunit